MGKYLHALQNLGQWFERQKRLLPWRDQPTLYRVWVSEIMLQQTQVITVVPYFERFMARFPTLESLATAPQDDVLMNWAGLGYYSRARNLHKGAQQIGNEKGFPLTREGWLEIPGVGNYTAGAILSIALNQPEAILDGNVERVLSRIRRVNRQKGDSGYKERLWKLARFFVTDAHRHGIDPRVTNQALMELGATICTPRKPKCLLCPMTGICRAQQQGDPEAYPPKKKPKEWVAVKEELHCVLDQNGKLLMRKRQPGEWRAGLWDFLTEAPGIEGGGTVKGLKKLGSVQTKHVVTRHKVSRTTHVWQASGKVLWGAAESAPLAGMPEAPTPAAIRWISVAEPDVALGSALKRTLGEIREQFPDLLD